MTIIKSDDRYPPYVEVTFYQAQCTSCGLVVDDYSDGTYSALANPLDAISDAVDYLDWQWYGDKGGALCHRCFICSVCGRDADDDHEGHGHTPIGERKT